MSNAHPPLYISGTGKLLNPFLSIGDIKQNPLQQIGAVRTYHINEIWQNEAENYFNRASLIFIRPEDLSCNFYKLKINFLFRYS